MKPWRAIIKRSTLIHIIVWAVIFALPYIFAAPHEKRNPKQTAFNGFLTTTTALWMGVFYLNALLLVPKMFFKKEYLKYLLFALALFCLMGALSAGLSKLFELGFPISVGSTVKGTLFPFLFVMMVSMSYKTIYDRIQADAITAEKQKETLKTELSFLRSQISPHFLFNVLNNIVSLVRLKSEELEPTILKLSSLMQYMLYETDEEKVLLADEVQYLQSYIDLQQQRFGSKVRISAELAVDTLGNTIEPMLLIPFVENAFKHGVGLIKHPVITISLATQNDKLSFFVRNKYSLENETRDRTSGIGLSNVRRRLELLYGKNHSLEIEKDEEFYTVHLQIKLTT